MPKVWNKHDPQRPRDAVYVGRPSKWGNPHVVVGSKRGEALARYRADIEALDPNQAHAFVNECITELRGKDLVCWCAPLPCHADILLKIANG